MYCQSLTPTTVSSPHTPFYLHRHCWRHISWLRGETGKITSFYIQSELLHLPPKQNSSQTPAHSRGNTWKLPGPRNWDRGEDSEPWYRTEHSSETSLTPASAGLETGCLKEEQEVRPSGTITIKLNQMLWIPLLGAILLSPGLEQHHLIGPFSSLISLIQKVYKINC